MDGPKINFLQPDKIEYYAVECTRNLIGADSWDDARSMWYEWVSSRGPYDDKITFIRIGTFTAASRSQPFLKFNLLLWLRRGTRIQDFGHLL